MFRLSKDHPLWPDRRLYDLYTEAHTPWDWHEPIFALAQELGMVAFSAPFDPTAVDFLVGLGVPLIKSASSEITDLPLIRAIAGDRPADDHLHRHGDPGRDRPGGAGGARDRQRAT